MLSLCGLTYKFIQNNTACTSQKGIVLPLGNPLLNQQQYPAQVTWRILIGADTAVPLNNFAFTRKVVLKRRTSGAPLRSTSQLAASGVPAAFYLEVLQRPF